MGWMRREDEADVNMETRERGLLRGNGTCRNGIETRMVTERNENDHEYSTPRAMTGKTDGYFMVTRNVCRALLPFLRTDNIPKMCPWQ